MMAELKEKSRSGIARQMEAAMATNSSSFAEGFAPQNQPLKGSSQDRVIAALPLKKKDLLLPPTGRAKKLNLMPRVRSGGNRSGVGQFGFGIGIGGSNNNPSKLMRTMSTPKNQQPQRLDALEVARQETDGMPSEVAFDMATGGHDFGQFPIIATTSTLSWHTFKENNDKTFQWPPVVDEEKQAAIEVAAQKALQDAQLGITALQPASSLQDEETDGYETEEELAVIENEKHDDEDEDSEQEDEQVKEQEQKKEQLKEAKDVVKSSSFTSQKSFGRKRSGISVKPRKLSLEETQDVVKLSSFTSRKSLGRNRSGVSLKSREQSDVSLNPPSIVQQCSATVMTEVVEKEDQADTAKEETNKKEVFINKNKGMIKVEDIKEETIKVEDIKKESDMKEDQLQEDIDRVISSSRKTSTPKDNASSSTSPPKKEKGFGMSRILLKRKTKVSTLRKKKSNDPSKKKSKESAGPGMSSATSRSTSSNSKDSAREKNGGGMLKLRRKVRMLGGYRRGSNDSKKPSQRQQQRTSAYNLDTIEEVSSASPVKKREEQKGLGTVIVTPVKVTINNGKVKTPPTAGSAMSLSPSGLSPKSANSSNSRLGALPPAMPDRIQTTSQLTGIRTVGPPDDTSVSGSSSCSSSSDPSSSKFSGSGSNGRGEDPPDNMEPDGNITFLRTAGTFASQEGFEPSVMAVPALMHRGDDQDVAQMLNMYSTSYKLKALMDRKEQEEAQRAQAEREEAMKKRAEAKAAADEERKRAADAAQAAKENEMAEVNSMVASGDDDSTVGTNRSAALLETVLSKDVSLRIGYNGDEHEHHGIISTSADVLVEVSKNEFQHGEGEIEVIKCMGLDDIELSNSMHETSRCRRKTRPEADIEEGEEEHSNEDECDDTMKQDSKKTAKTDHTDQTTKESQKTAKTPEKANSVTAPPSPMLPPKSPLTKQRTGRLGRILNLNNKEGNNGEGGGRARSKSRTRTRTRARSKSKPRARSKSQDAGRMTRFGRKKKQPTTDAVDNNKGIPDCVSIARTTVSKKGLSSEAKAALHRRQGSSPNHPLEEMEEVVITPVATPRLNRKGRRGQGLSNHAHKVINGDDEKEIIHNRNKGLSRKAKHQIEREQETEEELEEQFEDIEVAFGSDKKKYSDGRKNQHLRPVRSEAEHTYHSRFAGSYIDSDDESKSRYGDGSDSSSYDDSYGSEDDDDRSFASESASDYTDAEEERSAYNRSFDTNDRSFNTRETRTSEGGKDNCKLFAPFGIPQEEIIEDLKDAFDESTAFIQQSFSEWFDITADLDARSSSMQVNRGRRMQSGLSNVAVREKSKSSKKKSKKKVKNDGAEKRTKARKDGAEKRTKPKKKSAESEKDRPRRSGGETDRRSRIEQRGKSKSRREKKVVKKPRVKSSRPRTMMV